MSTHKQIGSVPSITPANDVSQSQGGGLARYAMLICCAVMVLPIAVYFARGGTLEGVAGNIGLLAPLIACAGMHLVLHRLMGGSCHGSKSESEPRDSDR